MNETSQLTKKSIDSVLKSIKKENTVALLHADWCYHCKQFKPEWDKFVKNQKLQGVTITEIESSQLDQLAGKKKELYERLVGNEGLGFPTVLMFSQGKRFTYAGERTEKALLRHVKAFVKKEQQKGGSLAEKIRAIEKLEDSLIRMVEKKLKVRIE